MDIKPLVWTYKPCPNAMYPDIYIAFTPFGRFLINWKYWKDCRAYELAETPWGDDWVVFGSLQEAKEEAEAKWQKKLKECFNA